MKPRGIRNNNPGNIRKSNVKWQGLAAEQTDGAFYQFTRPEYGIRALCRVAKKHHEENEDVDAFIRFKGRER